MKGVSNSVAEEQIYLIIVLDIAVFTYYVPYTAWLFVLVVTVVNGGLCAVPGFPG